MSPVTYYKEPEAKTGYQLDADTTFWSVCVAEAAENLLQDPMLETYESRSFTTYLRNSFPAATTGAYTFSAYVRGTSHVTIGFQGDPDVWVYKTTYRLARPEQWTRIEFSARLTAGYYFCVLDSPATACTTIAWQVEAKPYATTYFDGTFGMWHPYACGEYGFTATPYASSSWRTAATRSGGRYVPLSDLGFHTLSITGSGPEKFDYNFSSNLNGAHYLESSQRQQREFVIGGQIFGCSFEDLNAKREALVQLFRPDHNGRVEPLRLRINLGANAPDRELFAYVLEGLEGEINNRHQQSFALRLKTAEEPNFLGAFNDLVAATPATQTFVVAGRSEEGVWTNYVHDGGSGAITRIDHDVQNHLIVAGSIDGVVHYLKPSGSSAATLLGPNTSGSASVVRDLCVSKTYPAQICLIGDIQWSGLTVDGALHYDEFDLSWEDMGAGSGATCVCWQGDYFYVGGTQVAGHYGCAKYYIPDGIWMFMGGEMSGLSECVSIKVGPDGCIYLFGDFYINDTPIGRWARYDPVADKIEGLGRIWPGLTFGRTDNLYDVAYDQRGQLFVAAYVEEDPVQDRSLMVAHGYRFEKRKLYSRQVQNTHAIALAGASENLYVSGMLASLGTNQAYPRENAIHRMWSQYGAYALTPFDFLFPLPAEPDYVPIHTIREKLYFAPNTAYDLRAGVPTTVPYGGTAPACLRLHLVGPLTIYSIWNWTTRKQVIFNRPVTVARGMRAYLYMQSGTIFFQDASDPARLPQPLALNPAASDSHALLIVPGNNQLTVFYESDAGDTGVVRLAWREEYNNL